MSTIVSTGFKLAQTVISNGAVTGNEWSNPNNLLLTDGDVSESNPGAGVASDVIIGNFLAQVPANAVIVGIELQIIAKRGAQTSPVLTLSPNAVDDTSGTDAYYPYVTPFTGLTLDLESYILGSPTYLFATSWTPDMINNFKLQFLANGDISVDTALLNVFYYIPDSTSDVIVVGDSCDDCNSPIQAQPFYLAQPFLSGDRYAYLQSFNYPDGTPIQYADLGACGGYITLVFDPAVPKVGNGNFEENAKTAVWETMPDGTVRLDFGDITVFRGLMFHTPYTADADLRSNHDQNSKVIISDSAPFLGQYLQRCQIGAVVSAPIEVLSEGSDIVKPAVKLNFKGGGVVVLQNGGDPEQADITISGIAPTTPVVVDVGSGTSGSSQVSSLQFDITVSGVNRGLLVQVSTEQLATISSITFNGTPLIQKISKVDAGNNLRNEQWFLTAPSLGTFSVIITLSQPAYISAGGEALVSVNQSSSTGATASSGGTSLAPAVNLVTTVDNSNIFDGITTAKTPILYTPGTDQVLEWHFTANTDTRQGASTYLPAGSTPDAITMQYAITQNTPWIMTALEIKGLPGATPVVTGLTVEDVPTGVIVPNTSLLVFPAGSVTNPLANKAVITFPTPTTDKFVAATATDTTPSYLNSKLNIYSSDISVTVTKTITNPAGNEIIDIDLTVPPPVASAGLYTVNADETVATWWSTTLPPALGTNGGTNSATPWTFSSFNDITSKTGDYVQIGNTGDTSAFCTFLTDTQQFTSTKDLRVKWVYKIVATNALYHFGFGLGNNATSFEDKTSNVRAARFIVENATIYAVVGDGTGVTVSSALTGVTTGALNIYEIVWTSGVNFKFYVNGVLKATISTTMPTTGAMNFGTSVIRNGGGGGPVYQFANVTISREL